MQILWLWIVAVSGEIAAALALAVNNPRVQQASIWVMQRAESILWRARDTWQYLQQNAGGSIIANTRPIVDMVMNEEWPAIEARLVSLGLGPTQIQELRAGLSRICWEKWLQTFTSFAQQAQRNNPYINPFEYWGIFKSATARTVPAGSVIRVHSTSGRATKPDGSVFSESKPFDVLIYRAELINDGMNPWPLYGKYVGGESSTVGSDPTDVVVPPFSSVSVVSSSSESGAGTVLAIVGGSLLAGIILAAVLKE